MRTRTNDKFEIICHVFRVQIGTEFYSVIATGSRYKISEYFKNELGATKVIWLKSMICRNSKVFNLGRKSKVVARNGFVLKMEFLHELGTIRSKALNDEQDKKRERGERLLEVKIG